MSAISVPPDARAPHCVRYVLPAVETIVETAVPRQEYAVGEDTAVVEAVGETMAARRRIAATLELLPATKISGEEVSPAEGGSKSWHVPGPLPAVAPV